MNEYLVDTSDLFLFCANYKVYSITFFTMYH